MNIKQEKILATYNISYEQIQLIVTNKQGGNITIIQMLFIKKKNQGICIFWRIKKNDKHSKLILMMNTDY